MSFHFLLIFHLNLISYELSCIDGKKDGARKNLTPNNKKSKRKRLMNFISKGFKHKDKVKMIKRRNSADFSRSKHELEIEHQNIYHIKKASIGKQGFLKMPLELIESPIEQILNYPDGQLASQFRNSNDIAKSVLMKNSENNQLDQNMIEQNADDFTKMNPFQKHSNEEEHFGYVYAKFPEPNYWKRYYLKFIGPIMYFYKSVKDNDYKVWYTIYKCNIDVYKSTVKNDDDTEYDVFVISHKYDTRYILLSMTDDKLTNQYLRNLKEKTGITPLGMMEFNESIRHPIGIMYLHIDKLIGIEVPDNTYIRIQLDPYQIETRHVNKTNNKNEFHQRFYLPIHNHFNQLILEILFYENEGWFREKRKELNIATIIIPLVQLNTYMRRAVGDKLKLPFKIENKKLLSSLMKNKSQKDFNEENKPDSKDDINNGKHYLMNKLRTNIECKGVHEKCLVIDIQDHTSINSLYAFHENRNRCEDRILNTTYSFK